MLDEQTPRGSAAADEAAAEHVPDGASGEEHADLAAAFEEERTKAQTYFHNWQRSVADFQNYKRRTEEERANHQRLANLAFVMNILPIVDDLDRALENLDPSLAGVQWVEGIRQIQRKFEGALQASGVQEIQTDGMDFDPTLHEAVGQEDGEPGKVTRVFQKGYMMGDRVIRPAMVMVGK